MYLCGSDGRVFNLICLPQSSSVTFAPNRFGPIASWCDTPKRVALVLTRSGDLLIFKDRRLQFAKRRGSWRYYTHTPIVSRLGAGRKALRTAVYESCLDVSFARTGGCIAVLNATEEGRLPRFVINAEMLETAKRTHTKLLRSTIRKRFHLLDRRLRQELISLDGAVVLRHSGEVLAVGTIVRVPSGSKGGGRLAAAMQLSKLGLGVKISADGPVIGYRNREETFRL
jgi:hypothetical protein